MTPAPRRLSLDYLTVSGATPVEQVEAAAAAGFDSVGLRFLSPPDLVLGTRWSTTDRAPCGRSDAHAGATGVRPLDVEVFFLGLDAGRERAIRAADAAAEAGAATLLAVIADDERARAPDRFAWLCDMAARTRAWTSRSSSCAGARSRQSTTRWRSWPLPTGRTPAICVDALHLSRSGGQPGTAAGAAGGQALRPAVRRARGRRLRRGMLKAEARSDRLLPGEGELWLDRLLAAIPADMPISVEVPHRVHRRAERDGTSSESPGRRSGIPGA